MVAAVGAVALVLPGGASAFTQDSVAGTAIGQFGAGTPVLYEINARSGPRGQSPFGEVTAHVLAPLQTSVFFNGSVTCLNVQGKVALLKLESIESDSGVIGPLSMRITDNADSTTPDLMEVTFATGESDECASPESSVILPSTVTSGDVVVIDDGKCSKKLDRKKPFCPPPPPPDEEPPV